MTALTSQVLSGLDQEMSGEAFEGVTENEKSYLTQGSASYCYSGLREIWF